MSFIGEALLSAAITTLFNKLSSSDLLQFARQEQIEADLNKWKKILLKIEAVIDDAEEKQTTNRLVEIWLGELKNLVYDVEDVLDDFATESLRRKLLDEPHASTSKVRKLIPTCLTGLSPQSLKRNSTMASQVKEITARWQQIVEDRNSFGLIENLGARSNRVIYQRPPATHLNEPRIYGREKDKEAMLELLLKNDDADAKFSVISVQGMGGIGKTTLAQLAYNDIKVETHFDIKAWVCVSEDFDIVRITKTILRSIASETNVGEDLSKLHDKLKKKLSGKKFFIVLDDVWHENYEEWTILCRPFEAGSFGSKIVVTTRNHGVSSMVGALPAYQLEELSNDECLSIFTYHSLGKLDFHEHQHLKEIGEKIVKRCKGLPLAAKTLGGLLRGKISSKDWKDVLDSNMWNLMKEKSGVLPALRVSYHHLPPHLKRCFAYCSIFPKDYKFCKQDIILLWMAEGFLETDRSEKQKEDLGNEYFEDLHSRSFFQPSSSNASSFMIHDLIHDLAEWAAGDFYSRVENMSEDERRWKISESIHHLSHINYGPPDYGHINKFKAFNNKMKSLRTFFTLPWDCYYSSSTYLDFPHMLLPLRRLRVLSLYGYPISNLPNSIGDMKLLHHLDLSDTLIKFLPDSINTLYNLETLLLKRCYRLKRLCSDMGNLIKLRHLIVDHENHLEAMPLRIGKLTRLRTLPFFAVGKDMGSGIRELKDLTLLRERLHISMLENVNDFGDPEKADLNGKGDLKDLVLEWSCSNGGSDEKEIAAQVFEKLLPSQKLESLWIKGYGSTRFPQWLGDTSLSSVVTLKFENCKNCASFPSIGQLPSLKKLVIRNMDGIERLGPEFYGHGYSMAPFQSLEKFKIQNLQDWRDWIPCGSGRNVEAFPRLRRLSISQCPKLLGKLPEHLPSLENLFISLCDALQSLPTAWMHSSNTSLKDMFIKGCNSLTCIGRVHLPPNLKWLTICFCSNLVSVLDEEQVSGICNNTSCQSLPDTVGKMELPSCSNLATLGSTGNLPKAVRYHSIQRFSINDCEKLETLPCNNNLISLKNLEIRHCPAMVSIPEGGFPTSLTSLVILETNICKSLFEWGLHRLTSLEELNITGGCPDVMSFPQEEIDMILPVSLKSLCISDFPNLERLSSIAQNLTCLEKLSLSYCPKLKYFPDDGLPQSLKQYRIFVCPLCKEGEGLVWSNLIAYLSDHLSRSFDKSDWASESEEE